MRARVGEVPGRQPLACQLRLFSAPGRAEPGGQNAGKGAVKALVITRCHRVARGAHMRVVHQQVLGAEMTVEHQRQQQVAEIALERAGFVHQLMRIDDANHAGGDADAEHDAQGLPQGVIRHPGHMPERAVDQAELHREPDPGEQAEPEQLTVRRIGVGIAQVLARQRIQKRHQHPAVEGDQEEGPAALQRRQHNKRHESQGQPVGPGAQGRGGRGHRAVSCECGAGWRGVRRRWMPSRARTVSCASGTGSRPSTRSNR